MAEIKDGSTVAVFGCGPVGLFAIINARLMGASRVFAIDGLTDRLERARHLGAECINFEKEDPIQVLSRLTGEIGVNCAIDAVGIDANHSHCGHSHSEVQWQPGDAPAQALQLGRSRLGKGWCAIDYRCLPADF